MGTTMNEQTKICTKCHAEKPFNEFYKHKKRKDGIGSYCKACDSMCNKAYREANPEKVKVYNKTYREKNPDKVSVCNKAWRKAKCKTDPKFRLCRNISNAIYIALRGNKSGRHWEDLVGYSLNQLRAHLGKQLKEGMTWENYGLWHIDHRIPISVHNFTEIEHADFKRCFALKNLQPMWSEDNFKKHAKLDKHFQPSLLI